jgi:tetratricopeptide (TPR) repeat protein
MAKVVKFPVQTPEKFGPQRAHKKKVSDPKAPRQLNLFTGGGKVVRLHQLTPFEEALLQDDQGNKQAAKTQYLKAIEEGDCVADAYCNLAIIESQNGNYAKAIDGFTQCLKHDPRHYEAHYNLANLYAELNNLALAKVHYEIAIEIEPSFTNSYFNLGLTLAMRKEFKDAIRVLDQYRKLTPADDHKQVDDLIQKLIHF